MILVIDNYDSFVYNLAQYIGELGWEPLVVRNDETTPAEIEALGPSHIVISPGPCTPLEAGISNDVVERLGGRIPILGVCLGHQSIGHVYGARVLRAENPTHGKTSIIKHDGRSVYAGLPNPFPATRYHSLLLQSGSLPPALMLSACTPEGEVMGVRHRRYIVEGVQFHPESILTDVGHDLLRTFLGFDRATWDGEFPPADGTPAY